MARAVVVTLGVDVGAIVVVVLDSGIVADVDIVLALLAPTLIPVVIGAAVLKAVVDSAESNEDVVPYSTAVDVGKLVALDDVIVVDVDVDPCGVGAGVEVDAANEDVVPYDTAVDVGKLVVLDDVMSVAVVVEQFGPV